MIQFIKTRQVKNPIRNVAENAGIDFFIPENTEDFIKALKNKNSDLTILDNIEQALFLYNLNEQSYITTWDGKIYIAPHKDIIIPSGIKSKFPNNLALIANNKSGIATKKKLVFGASVIDASYQGEWHLHLINTSKKVQEIECGQKIIQFIPHLISADELEVLDMTEEEFFTEKTSRGEGWAGSTGI